MSISQVSKTARSFRILALPLTRPSPSDLARKSLTYYNFTFPPPPNRQPNEGKPPAWQPSWMPKQGVAKWTTQKAEDIWTNFGKAKSGWKAKLYDYGSRVQDQLDFEELSLKAVDPALGPTVLHPDVNGKDHVYDPQSLPKVHIPLVFPSSVQTAPEALDLLRAVLAHRTPRHRREFWKFAIIAPLTAPFALVPIIPNIPFFFCVWRAWSHYKAYRASQYLESLLSQGAIVPTESKALDAIYAQCSPAAKTPISKESATPRATLLLTEEAIPDIVNLFDLQTNSLDLYRALTQAQTRVENGGGGHL